MSITVAMYDKSFEHIGANLEALALDINVLTFNKEGQVLREGIVVSTHETEIDYVWLTQHLKADGVQEEIFDLLLGFKSINVLQTFNAGLDHPFYKKLSDKGTRICNSSAQAVAISEYVMAQVMSLVHPIDLQRDLNTRGQWTQTPFRELSRTNWLIIGYGPIGQEIAKRVKPFDASISVIRRTPADSEMIDRVGTMADLDRFLPEADIIVLACPLNDDTRGFADTRFFQALKRGSILVNIARGPLIDDTAMIAALDDGRLATAVLDVFHTEPLPENDPLWSHPKIRMTSHTSFFGEGVRDRWDQLFLDNLPRYVSGEALIYEVDPSVIV